MSLKEGNQNGGRRFSSRVHNIFESAINKVSWTKLYMLDDHYECTIVYR
jgi:hypothetical protein